VTAPPDTDDEQRRLTSTLHALDHASRLAETASGPIDFGTMRDGPDDVRAGELCSAAMRSATAVAAEIVEPPDVAQSPRLELAPSGAAGVLGAAAMSTDKGLVELKRCATELGDLPRAHRSATLGAVANGTLTADAAMVRVDTVGSLEALAHHAWRSAAHLLGRTE
jgi:phosphate:Na+ symporter